MTDTDVVLVKKPIDPEKKAKIDEYVKNFKRRQYHENPEIREKIKAKSRDYYKKNGLSETHRCPKCYKRLIADTPCNCQIQTKTKKQLKIE